MKTSGICPSCEKQLPMSAVIRAPTPFRVRCRHCKEKLSVQMRGMWQLTILVSLMCAGLTLACIFSLFAFGLTGLAISCAGFLLFWIVLEVGTAVLFFTYARFTFDD